MAVITADELAARIGGVAPDSSMLETAIALIEKYSPAAPASVKLEAGVRIVGWLRRTPASALSAVSMGPASTRYDRGRTQSPLRGSGAMGILSPWRTHGGSV